MSGVNRDLLSLTTLWTYVMILIATTTCSEQSRKHTHQRDFRIIKSAWTWANQDGLANRRHKQWGSISIHTQSSCSGIMRYSRQRHTQDTAIPLHQVVFALHSHHPWWWRRASDAASNVDQPRSTVELAICRVHL